MMRNDRRFGSEQDTPMFSVIFEVLPRQGRKEEYLDLAKGLRPILEKMDGFVDVERYESRTRPGWVLSQSTWRDEKSMVRWRTQRDHYFVQSKGRFEVFADYHLRIGEITADTDPPAGLAVLEQRFDETEVGVAKLVTLTEATPERGADLTAKADRLPFHLGLDPSGDTIAEHDVFESIYNPGKLVLLASWKDTDAGKAWSPRKLSGVEKLRHRKIRIVRDYGRFDRREAPQYYAGVKDAPAK
jgi:heme-degrading monooxygenase HmoA